MEPLDQMNGCLLLQETLNHGVTLNFGAMRAHVVSNGLWTPQLGVRNFLTVTISRKTVCYLMGTHGLFHKDTVRASSSKLIVSHLTNSTKKSSS